MANFWNKTWLSFCLTFLFAEAQIFKNHFLLRLVSWHNLTFNNINSTLSRGIRISPKVYSSAGENDEGKIASLWDGIDVDQAADKTITEPASFSETELYVPPHLPEFTSNYTLPDGFIWGWGSTAPQIEGAVKDDRRGPSIWDFVAHKVPGFVSDSNSFDIATNHYYLYKVDIDRMAAMEVPYYSMSISWSRIFPFGKGTVNKVGLQHYINEVDYLLSKGITPIVTLYHWDMPQALQNAYGGWLDRAVIDDFAKYVRVVFHALAPKVNIWITLNEPQVFCNDYASWPDAGVPDEVFPVFGYSTEERRYRCGHHALLAHAKAVEIYRKEFEPLYGKGKISFANSWDFTPPYSDSQEDLEASVRSLELSAGWFGNPIYIDGDYSQVIKDLVGKYLPNFTEEEKSLVHGSTDFYAWDSYSGHPVQGTQDGFQLCYEDPTDESWPGCFEEVFNLPGGWPIGNRADVGVSNWLYDTPLLFYQGVLWAWNHFGPSEFFIPEMGFSVWGESKMELDQARYDDPRVQYYEGYLNQVLKLVNEDKVNITGIIAWSSWDNVEWRQGTGTRFGLQHVDYGTQQRTYKKSAFYLRHFFENYIK